MLFSGFGHKLSERLHEAYLLVKAVENVFFGFRFAFDVLFFVNVDCGFVAVKDGIGIWQRRLLELFDLPDAFKDEALVSGRHVASNLVQTDLLCVVVEV